MSNTTNLVLPYLAVGQAQKHVTVNETLRRLDAVVQLSVVSASITAQPASPADGAVYIVPSGKSGADWNGYANWSLAYYRDGAWEQVSPREGWLAYVRDTDQLLAYTGAAWALFAPGKLLTVSASDRILGRASSGAGAAEELVFTDQAQQLCGDTSFRAMCATLGAWRVLAASGVASSHTGDTTETALATITLPGGAMGPNGALRITSLWSYPNSANAKTIRCRFGGSGVSGTPLMVIGATTTNNNTFQRMVQNRNAQNAQVSGAAGNGGTFGASTGGVVTASVDTSVDQPIVLSGAVANAGETITLESYVVELAYGA